MLATVLVIPFDLPRAEVFDFVANEANLSLWLGPAERYETGPVDADSRTGVVDVWLRPIGTRDWGRLPIRVLDTAPGASVLTVTCFGGSEAGEAEFAREAPLWGRGMEVLPELVRQSLLRG